PEVRDVRVGPVPHDLGVEPGNARVTQVDVHGAAPADRRHLLGQRDDRPRLLDANVGSLHKVLLPGCVATEVLRSSYPLACVSYHIYGWRFARTGPGAGALGERTVTARDGRPHAGFLRPEGDRPPCPTGAKRAEVHCRASLLEEHEMAHKPSKG